MSRRVRALITIARFLGEGTLMDLLRLLVPLVFAGLAGCSPHDGAPYSSRGDINGAGGMHAPSGGDSEATRGYKMTMTGMLDNMPAFSGNADRDFMMQMRGHHHAAIAMAEVQLVHGSDPGAKSLAQRIITDQKAEIEEIDIWLSSRP